jgi:hypothetical protein
VGGRDEELSVDSAAQVLGEFAGTQKKKKKKKSRRRRRSNYRRSSSRSKHNNNRKSTGAGHLRFGQSTRVFVTTQVTMALGRISSDPSGERRRQRRRQREDKETGEE